ncbi:hypothetical protein EVAR_51312_1 [Eumeta japonica]|uniref:Uncharacterized protein n=1 Tax=Eumeta variegata TaxID=151549 RepID=A0A4C1XSW9_EUMVA|nr:hypothetical protein EVAR_51312_1 [Eumeta japonica]
MLRAALELVGLRNRGIVDRRTVIKISAFPQRNNPVRFTKKCRCAARTSNSNHQSYLGGIFNLPPVKTIPNKDGLPCPGPRRSRRKPRSVDL